jgi:hypothetical protein
MHKLLTVHAQRISNHLPIAAYQEYPFSSYSAHAQMKAARTLNLLLHVYFNYRPILNSCSNSPLRRVYDSLA